MRPISLTMSAFGSYADEVTVDFTEIQGGVFLITGDTGAGKTTIFDAIAYALYDRTSGGRRDGSMMRSQYAKEDVETYVEYSFLYRGSAYCIHRNPEYMRVGKRRYADGSVRLVKEIPAVELTLPDGSVFRGKKKETDQKIQEIIGLDVEQFTQTVMLAQGEFLKLLHAESRDRKKIFSKIFHTKIFYHIQEELKKRTASLYAELEDTIKDCLREMQHVQINKGSHEEKEWEVLKEQRFPSEEETLLILDRVIEKGKDEEKKKRKMIEEEKKRLAGLNGKLKEAETVNRLFSALLQVREEREELSAKEAVYEELTEQLGRGKRAAIVSAVEERYIEARQQLKRTKQQIEALELQMVNADAAIKEQKKSAQAAGKNLQEREPKLNRAIFSLQNEMEQYEKLEQLQLSSHAEQEILKSMQKQTEDIDKTVKELKERLESARKRQEELERAPAEVEKLMGQAVQLGRRTEELRMLDKHIEEVYQLRDMCAEQEKQVKLHATVCREAAFCYEEMYQAFMEEQAGILAQELREGTPCPVCGSREHPDIRTLSEKAPTQEMIKEAKSERDRTDLLREDSVRRFRETLGRLRSEEARLEEECVKTFQDAYTPGEERKLTTKEIMKCLSEQKSVQKACADMKKKEEEYTKIKQEQSEISIRLFEHEEKLQAQKEQLTEQEHKSHALQANIKVRKEQLTFSSKEKAVQQLQLAQTELNQLRQAFEDAETSVQSAVQTYKQKEGEQKGERQHEMVFRVKSDSLEKEFQTEMRDQGFLTEEDYSRSRLTQEVLEKGEKELQDYKRKIRENSAVQSSLTEQLKDKEQADTDDIEQALRSVDEALSCLLDMQSKIRGDNEENRKAMEKLRSYFQKQGDVRREYEMIGNLSKTANGNLSGSVKLDFETYIQRQYFKRIIGAANQRLSKMNRGEFLLQCREVKDLGGQGQTGLDLDIYHMVSGAVRDVRTLSGGESFMAALSMALGLSDIVQNTAGAIRLETMFVDEGFGSLDEGSREKAINVLSELAGDRCLVGIISHVNELKEQIDCRLEVVRTENGSDAHWLLK